MTMARTMSQFKLSEKDVETFYTEGYIYAPKFIDRQTVDALNREHEAFANRQDAKTKAGEWKSSGFTHFDEHAGQFPETVKMMQHPEIVETLEGILSDGVRLWLGMYAVVPPYGKGLEWHQDNQYTHVLGHMLNVFIALDEITQENAGLWIAPGSHLLGRQPDLNAAGSEHRRAAEPANGIPCQPMQPGDAVIFHRETLHHSKENRTDQPRRAFAFQAAAYSCRYASTGKLLSDRELLAPRKAGA
ncbi:phytanoyl-CoA dioxygenase family protein [Paenibacillus sp. GCM10027626]|uniref:phytanoyl-CoA dioxygenase family protein n=1 Tax=Paenibacillus sp. GCM10027626 TaxID=3273411 RepID=UPI00362CAFC9